MDNAEPKFMEPCHRLSIKLTWLRVYFDDNSYNWSIAKIRVKRNNINENIFFYSSCPSLLIPSIHQCRDRIYFFVSKLSLAFFMNHTISNQILSSTFNFELMKNQKCGDKTSLSALLLVTNEIDCEAIDKTNSTTRRVLLKVTLGQPPHFHNSIKLGVISSTLITCIFCSL